MTNKMTFEQLEADWEVWKVSPSGSSELGELFARSTPIDSATFTKGHIDSGVAVINGCIMLNYDDIVL